MNSYLSTTVKKSTDELLTKAHLYLDTIWMVYPTDDFIDVTGTRGGKYKTYRFYYSGLVTER